MATSQKRIKGLTRRCFPVLPPRCCINRNKTVSSISSLGSTIINVNPAMVATRYRDKADSWRVTKSQVRRTRSHEFVYKWAQSSRVNSSSRNKSCACTVWPDQHKVACFSLLLAPLPFELLLSVTGGCRFLSCNGCHWN